MRNVLCFFAFVLVLVCLPASAQDKWISLEKTTGSGLFQEKCGMCHRAGGMGTGILGRRMSAELSLLENRKDLKGPYIQNVVRGGFGIMFPLSRGEVSDKQLEKIIDYLVKDGD
jgi:mono/diheme cytochrome c family protein